MYLVDILPRNDITECIDEIGYSLFGITLKKELINCLSIFIPFAHTKIIRIRNHFQIILKIFLKIKYKHLVFLRVYT